MKIGLDLNGVLIDAREAKRRALEEVTGLAIPPMIFAGKHVVFEQAQFRMKGGTGTRAISREEYGEAMRVLHETDAFFTFATPVPGAIESARKLSSGGVTLRIVSGVKGLTEGRIWAWVQQQDLPISEVIATRKRSKTPYYADCTAVVDDEHEHLAPVPANVRAILLLPERGMTGSRRVSSPKPCRPGIHVARGWSEAMRYIP